MSETGGSQTGTGQLSPQDSTDKSYLVMTNNKGKSVSTSIPIESGSGNMSEWVPRNIYEPCSVAYSKDTMKRMKSAKRSSTPRNLEVFQWSEASSTRISNGICPFGKFLSIAAVVSSLVSFIVILYLVATNRWENVSLPHHDSLSEGLLLLIQSFATGVFTTFVAATILCNGPITKNLYITIACGLFAIVLTDEVWVCRELMHNHNYQRTWNEGLTFQSDFSNWFSNNRPSGSGNEKTVPEWMNLIQSTHKCCGSNGPEDWHYHLNGSDIPDSCCVTQRKGCGFGYFHSPKKEIFTEGCAFSQSRLNSLSYKDIQVIQLAKFVESFIVLLLFVILNVCCKNGAIITQQSPFRPQQMPLSKHFDRLNF